MITVITSITKQQGFENLQRNLVSFESDWQLGMDILCLVADKQLYLEVRDYLKQNVDRGESLIVYDEGGLKAGGEYLGNRNEFVFLLDEDTLIPSGHITKLYNNYLDKRGAGFISGIEREFPCVLWVEDLYAQPRYIWSNTKDQHGLIEVDTSPVYGILTKANTYKELFCLGDLDSYGSLSYGIRLRRQGYQNYVNTEVEYKHGGK